MDIKKTLEQHELWLNTNGERGERANLEGANLEGANLYMAYLNGANLYKANLYKANLKGANLYGADLYEANLEGAYLIGANLNGANLAEANLYKANLKGANLYGADLYGAYLMGANLFGANLERANLERANLERANLTFINGKDIYVFNSSQHTAFAFDGIIKIGCECHSIEHWIENYVQIGKAAKYSDEEIKKYGAWIKLMAGEKNDLISHLARGIYSVRKAIWAQLRRFI